MRNCWNHSEMYTDNLNHFYSCCRHQPRSTAATVVATYVMIDKCENKRMCSKFNAIYMCVVYAWALGLWKINHWRKTNCCFRSFENFGIRELVFGFGTVNKNQHSVDELERFCYIRTEMTNSAKTLMGGQSTLNTFPNIFCRTFFTLDSIFNIGIFFRFIGCILSGINCLLICP